MTGTLQNLVNAAVTGSSYALISIGLTMVYGLLRILHVAHAAVYTLGAFVGLVVWEAGGGFWLGLAAAALICGLAGVGIFDGVYRHIADRSPVVALIASVGMLILAQSLFQQKFFFGPQKRPFTAQSGIPGVETGLVQLSSAQTSLLVLTVVVVAGLAVLFWRSQVGLQWRALAQDAAMANAIGIPVRRSMALNFFLGSALAGMAGMLVGAYEGRVYATMGAVVSYKAFVIVVMGGLGNVWGAIISGYLLALIETFFIVWFGFLLPRDAVAFLILVLVLMFRPRGLFGRVG